MTQELSKNNNQESKLLSISQVSDIFGVHQDTLRNWEREGILVPLRVGKRQDRRYRPEDIEAITHKMCSKLTLQQLEQFFGKVRIFYEGK